MVDRWIGRIDGMGNDVEIVGGQKAIFLLSMKPSPDVKPRFFSDFSGICPAWGIF